MNKPLLLLLLLLLLSLLFSCLTKLLSLRSDPRFYLISPKLLSHCLTTLSRQLDCLDPRYHQRIAVLFSSYSSESNNSPRPCISPWYGASFIVCLFVTGTFCCLYMCLSVFLLLLLVVYMSMNLITKWQLQMIQTSISFISYTKQMRKSMPQLVIQLRRVSLKRAK